MNNAMIWVSDISPNNSDCFLQKLYHLLVTARWT